MFLVGFPLLFGVLGAVLHFPGATFPAIGFLFSIFWAWVFGWRLYHLTRDRANYQLGFDGERYVGEELNRLFAEGFEIYHDLPFDGFNVDHVLVGPPGVFALETKTRRKPINKLGNKEYRVEFDGACLRWPWGTETRDIEQAVNNARTVAQWLTGAVGETVTVTPILTLPGWLVERKARSGSVQVVNPKEVVKVCHSTRYHLDEKLIRQICYQLDQKCKLEIE